MDFQHKVPIHLEQQDPFLFHLTVRQLLILGVGISLGYLIFSDMDISNWVGLILAILLLLICVAASVVVAFVRIKHRDLEQWGLVLFLYVTQPQYYRWHPLVIEENVHEQEASEDALTEEEEQVTW